MSSPTRVSIFYFFIFFALVILLELVCASCRLWTPIDGEFDDYIVNPKPSGYQVNILFFLHQLDLIDFESVCVWCIIG